MASSEEYGGLETVTVKHKGGSATITLHGAHIVSWIPDTAESNLLYLSPTAVYSRTTAIRGGVPVCFPQFAGQGPLPNHGFARKALWKVVSSTPDSVTLLLDPSCDGVDGEAHPDFEVRYTVSLEGTGGERLVMDRQIKNTAPDATFEQVLAAFPTPADLVFTDALHTYFAVPDVATTSVGGLQGCVYLDKTEGHALKTWEDELVTFPGEVDVGFRRAPLVTPIYTSQAQVEANTPTFEVVRSPSFRDLVVWNPGEELTSNMPDLESHKTFICVEAANLEPVVVHPQDVSSAQCHLLYHSPTA